MSTAASPAKASKKGEKKAPVFPVGTAAQRVLKKALRNAKGVEVIKDFQQANSLHTMVAAAFDTQPRYQAAATTRSKGKETVETLDTDSVLEFLSHLGVSHFKVNQRISDSLLKQLEDEIRKTTDDKPLLDLLSDVWGYAVKFKQVQLRPIIWTILRKLGEKTPPAVLQALAERDAEGNLKNEALYNPLPPLLQKLVWEADWAERISLDADMEPTTYLEKVSGTILFQTMHPCVTQYCTNKVSLAVLPKVMANGLGIHSHTARLQYARSKNLDHATSSLDGCFCGSFYTRYCLADSGQGVVLEKVGPSVFGQSDCRTA
eukprot:scaffold184_cov179-Amphora_coffeaeformis.AAC.12